MEKPLSALRPPHLSKVRACVEAHGNLGFLVLIADYESADHARNAAGGRLRAAGFKVIESYPGAAQDLLGIPRKGASLEELKWGLARAGIEGDFLISNVSHDEVDA